ncbi:MAG: glycosyltransferase family 2 protein [Lachnospiraceae bacterium]|nr:glycosyltransferase family 2 protein [Lachnospiraceae bacterium]
MEDKSVLVILNYNDYKTTSKLISAVGDYSVPGRVVVVDNMSTDDSFEELKKFVANANFKKASDGSERITVIQAPSNGGYAKGNNFGIRYGIEQFNPNVIFVANPDVSVSEDTFKKMADTLRASLMSNKSGMNQSVENKIGVLAPIVNQGANVWNLPGFIGMVESLFMVWFTIDKKNIKKKLINSKNEIETVGVVEGSFFAINREAYDAVDGLDENTFLYVEENILAKRLKNAGYEEAVLTSERYDHFHSVSIKKRYKSSKAKAFHNFYNSMTYYNKTYLKTGPIKNAIFNICYGLAYLERVVYDVLKPLGL